MMERERVLVSALDEMCPDWLIGDLKRRCQIVTTLGSPVETLQIDGEPVLEFYPLEYAIERTEDSYVIRYTQHYRHLRPPSPTNEERTP